MSSSKIKSWVIFTKERFDPISHLVMILLFVWAHLSLIKVQNLVQVVIITIIVIIFFFKLRLYDEIKDYELDCKINPNRPLARGLLNHSDLYKGIIISIFLEIILFSFVSLNALPIFILTVGYSLLMYKEFFIRDRIRPHLTIYAVSHTVVTVLLSLSILCAFNNSDIMSIDDQYIIFALNSWCLFNIFEFGRKTFLKSEERENVESYSKIFSPAGACILVLSQAAFSFWFLKRITLNQWVLPYYFIIFMALTVCSLLYLIKIHPKIGAIYRAFSSFYIVLIYSMFIVGQNWR